MEKLNDLSRRDAVKIAGVTGAAALAAAGQFDRAPGIIKAAGDQIRFGLIGTGSRGGYLLKHLHGIDNGGSTLRELDVNTFGDIANLPHDFFGDPMEDLSARMEAAARQETESNYQ